MNEKYVSRCEKRINRRKRTRDPPVAVIGNIASPVHPVSIDERIFRNSILPMALANKWIEVNSPDVVGHVENITVAEGTNDFTFTPGVYVCAYFTAYISAPTTLRLYFTITYGDGSQRSFQSNNVSGSGLVYFDVLITPICVMIIGRGDVGLPGSNVESLYGTLETIPITKIDLSGAQVSTSDEALAYGIIIQEPEVTQRKFSLWKQ